MGASTPSPSRLDPTGSSGAKPVQSRPFPWKNGRGGSPAGVEPFGLLTGQLAPAGRGLTANSTKGRYRGAVFAFTTPAKKVRPRLYRAHAGHQEATA